MARPAAVASAPLQASMANTSAPYFQPRRRKVFDAPGFPDPSLVTSTPLRRATTAALGNVPSR